MILRYKSLIIPYRRDLPVLSVAVFLKPGRDLGGRGRRRAAGRGAAGAGLDDHHRM